MLITSLQHPTHRYDTFTDTAASEKMSTDLRRFGSDVFVIVLSVDAWEWHASPTLAKVTIKR